MLAQILKKHEPLGAPKGPWFTCATSLDNSLLVAELTCTL